MQQFQNLLKVNLGDVLVEKGIDLVKKNRFSIGCGISECEIQELLYLNELICRKEEVCYIDEELEKQLTERINGKKM